MAAKPSQPFVPPASWSIYKKLPGLVLGFHGCDRTVGEDVLAGKTPHLNPSTNEYDWLGGGIYFWESNPWRAYQFAEEAASRNPKVTRGSIRDPFVVGAVIDLGHCCNLLESDALDELRRAHLLLKSALKHFEGRPMPTNKGKDFGARFLDKAVIEALHTIRRSTELPSYDTVRGAFVEGRALYRGAGFHEKNHIQIAVRDQACIKGYFRLPGL
jgi:hypothetical protein